MSTFSTTPGYDDFLKNLEGAIGANAESQQVSNFIDTGFEPLNEIMSGSPDGGLPGGRMVEVFAESATGKTALATKWMALTQSMGGICGFSDWERSFDVSLGVNGFGLDATPGRFIYKKPLTWEEGNTFAAKACEVIRTRKIIPPEAPILWVFDSIASAIPRSVREKGIEEYTMNDTTALARVTSTTLKVMAQFADEFNATFLYLNQLRLKPGVTYGDPRTTPGGKAMEFYATVRLALGREKVMKVVDGEREFVGQIIGIECVKSKLTKPFGKTKLRMTFDDNGVAHFDFTQSLLDAVIEAGKLPYSKPHVTWTDGKKYHVGPLAKKIDAEGLQAELKALYRS